MKIEQSISPLTWKLDPAHSTIRFMASISGIASFVASFKNFDARMVTAGEDLGTASLGLWVSTDSLETNDMHLDRYLTSACYFHASRYKLITFTSHYSAAADKGEKRRFTGDLSMMDISRAIQFDTAVQEQRTYAGSIERVAFSLGTEIDINDWALGTNLYAMVNSIRPDSIEIAFDMAFKRTDVLSKAEKYSPHLSNLIPQKNE